MPMTAERAADYLPLKYWCRRPPPAHVFVTLFRYAEKEYYAFRHGDAEWRWRRRRELRFSSFRLATLATLPSYAAAAILYFYVMLLLLLYRWFYSDILRRFHCRHTRLFFAALPHYIFFFIWLRYFRLKHERERGSVFSFCQPSHDMIYMALRIRWDERRLKRGRRATALQGAMPCCFFSGGRERLFSTLICFLLLSFLFPSFLIGHYREYIEVYIENIFFSSYILHDIFLRHNILDIY